MSEHYILEGKNPIPVDLMTWARWLDSRDESGKSVRQVASSKLGDIHVSTVFLGLDHSFGGPTPILFETMIFGGEHDQYQDRCSTWDEAEAMHTKACELAGIASPFAAGESFSKEKP